MCFINISCVKLLQNYIIIIIIFINCNWVITGWQWLFYMYTNIVIQSKGKAVPLQAWSGPEGSRKLRFPDFMTTVQDGGKAFSLTHRPALPSGNTPGTHFC